MTFHAREGKRGAYGSFRLQTSFGIHDSLSIPPELCPRSWRSVKSTLCTAVEENLLSIPKIEQLSEFLILYIIYFTSNLMIFLIKKKRKKRELVNSSNKVFGNISKYFQERRSKFMIQINNSFFIRSLIIYR